MTTPTVNALPQPQQGDFNDNAMIVLLSDGTLCGWGDNTTGVLCNGIVAATNSPAQRVCFNPNSTLPPTTATIATWAFTNADLYVVFSNGWVYAGGQNDYGQLGQGDTTDRPYLTRIEYFVTHSLSITNVWASGAHGTTSGGGCVYFLTSTGAIYACGQNAVGNLGTSNTTNQETPVACMKTGSVAMTGLSQQTQVSLACVNTSFSAFIYDPTTTSYYAAGYNAFGQLGVGNTTGQELFVQVTPSTHTITRIVANGGYINSTDYGGNAVLLDSAGKLWATGYNAHGELGNGSTTNHSTFAAMTNLSSSVAGFSFGGGWCGYGIAWLTSGSTYVWGYNGQNNLFLNVSTTPQSTPTLATYLPGLVSAAHLPKGNYLSTNSQLIVLTTSGLLAYAGDDNGQEGIGNLLNAGAYNFLPTPRQLLDGTETISSLFMHGYNVYQRWFILTNLGNLYACGSNVDSICTGGVSSDTMAANVEWYRIPFQQ